MAHPRRVNATIVWLLLAAAAPCAAAAPEKLLKLVNQGRQAIVELYVSGASDESWGSERLGDSALAPGRALPVNLGHARDCSFDIRVVFADNSVEERHDFDVCRNRQAVFDGSTAELLASHEVTVINQSPRPLREIYIVSGQTGGWGEDLLGDTGLPPTASARVSYHGSCHGDVRVVFDNDSAEERYAMDLCDHAPLAIRPGWATAD